VYAAVRKAFQATWEVADSTGALVSIEIRFDGLFQRVHRAGQLAGCQIAGQWGFDPMQQLLQLQGVVNGQMPFMALISFRARQDGMSIGQDQNGIVFYFKRLA
jgi:hypothetical protein